MDEKELLKQILDALTGNSSGRAPRPDGKDIKDFDTWAEKLRKHTDELIKSQPKLKTFADTVKLNGVQARDFGDELEKLEKQIQENVEAFHETKDVVHQQIVKQLELKKIMIEEAVAREQGRAAAINFGVGLTKILTTTIAGAAFDFVKGLQAGKDGIDLYGDAAKAGAKATTDGLTMVGDIAGTTGNALSKLPGLLGLVGTALSILGPILGTVATAMGKISQEGLSLLQKEVQDTQKAFRDATSSGALFADGMTGMRNSAQAAGLTTMQFAEVIKSQSANIAASGLGMTEGIKQLGQVKQAMRRSGIENSLLNLGYGFKEQAELIAQTQADMARSGRAGTNAQVAAATEEYAKNLRLISNLTGEDAKAKMKQVREQNNILAFQNKLAELGPDQQKAIEDAMANMSEIDRKAFRERVVMNGQVVSQEAALYEATNAGAREQNQRLYEIYQQGNFNLRAVTQTQGEYSQAIQDGAKGMQEVAVAAMVGGNQVTQTLASNALQAREVAQKTNKAAADRAIEELDKAGQTTDPLTRTVNEIDISAQNMKLALEKELTPAITTFAKQLINAGESIGEMLERLGIKKSSAAAKREELAQEYTSRNPIMSDGGIDYSAGSFAVGGIASGPTSGFHAMLHGTEAVIPLPDNRSVPVTIEGSSGSNDMSGIISMLESHLKDQVSQQQEMLRVMQDNRDYTQQLMHNLT